MKRTPLYEQHLALGAKMLPFAGYEMPIQYAGIREETLAVRRRSGMFDVSHMGEIRVRGKDAGAFLDWILSRPVQGKKTELVSYAILCLEDGGAVDDLLVYRFADADDYLLVVNAANKDKDVAYLRQMLPDWRRRNAGMGGATLIEDESELYGQIALQGPESAHFLAAALREEAFSEDFIASALAMKNYRSLKLERPGKPVPLILSRTGYTGEDGFELYLPEAETEAYWKRLLSLGVTPAGLGARDALRLEAGMPLYGHEMSESMNPLEAGVGFACVFGRDFIAEKTMREGQVKKLIAVVSESKAIPRDGYELLYEGHPVGTVSSGSFSPTLDKGIAFVRVDKDFPDDAETFSMEVHRKEQPFRRIQPPFVKRG